MKILTCNGKINLMGTSCVHGWDCVLGSQNPKNAGKNQQLLLISDTYVHIYIMCVYVCVCVYLFIYLFNPLFLI